MKMRSKALQVALICAILLFPITYPVASEPINSTNGVSVTNATSACAAFGVPLSPSIYLLNFILIYFTNPEIAANMPAYRARIPQEVYKCLVENPEGCPYADMAQYFDDEQPLESENTSWPIYCQTDPRWQALAPPEYQQT